MAATNRKPFLDKAEALLATIRSSVLVHAQDGVHPRHLKAPLDSARSLNVCAIKLEDERVAEATDTLEAWILLLASETDRISHTRTRSLLDQISEVEVALLACRSATGSSVLDVGDFVDESFESLRASKAPQPPAEPSKANEFEVDAEMLEVFREEAASLLQNIQTNLDLLATSPNDRNALWEIKRNAHTFKGAAGIVGLKKPSELAHRVEDLLDQLSPQDAGSRGEILNLLCNAAECLRALANGEKSRKLDARVTSIHRQLADAQRSAVKKSESPEDKGKPLAKIDAKIATVPPSKPTRNSSIVRISLERLDELVRNVRELVVSRSAFEQHIAELSHQVDESSSNTLRLQAASGKMREIDPISLLGPHDQFQRLQEAEFQQNAYEVSEAARDASVIDSGLGIVRTNFEALYERQHILIREIQERLIRLRNVEFGSIATRLQRTVRVTCDEEGKNAELTIENGSLEVDTQLIDVLIEPLMHLLKNAVVHGVEPAETRRLLGKPEAGKITVSVYRQDAFIQLAVSDDGAGIAFQTLVEKAVTANLVTRAEADSMTADRLNELVFLPGLTTAEQLNLNAGRGVGMSIVRESVASAGGTISIETWPQKGTTFTIRVPRPFADNEVVETSGIDVNAMLHGSEVSVLVVDDSPSVRLMMTRLIHKQGWHVHSAKHGIDALERLVSLKKLPSVILSDVEMPVMGGYEFIAALKDDESLKGIPVVFISSRTGEGERERALTAGAAEYLTKPYNELTLITLVDRLARFGELVNTSR